jgi:hypothetical protein
MCGMRVQRSKLRRPPRGEGQEAGHYSSLSRSSARVGREFSWSSELKMFKAGQVILQCKKDPIDGCLAPRTKACRQVDFQKENCNCAVYIMNQREARWREAYCFLTCISRVLMSPTIGALVECSYARKATLKGREQYRGFV